MAPFDKPIAVVKDNRNSAGIEICNPRRYPQNSQALKRALFKKNVDREVIKVKFDYID